MNFVYFNESTEPLENSALSKENITIARDSPWHRERRSQYPIQWRLLLNGITATKTILTHALLYKRIHISRQCLDVNYFWLCLYWMWHPRSIQTLLWLTETEIPHRVRLSGVLQWEAGDLFIHTVAVDIDSLTDSVSGLPIITSDDLVL